MFSSSRLFHKISHNRLFCETSNEVLVVFFFTDMGNAEIFTIWFGHKPGINGWLSTPERREKKMYYRWVYFLNYMDMMVLDIVSEWFKPCWILQERQKSIQIKKRLKYTIYRHGWCVAHHGIYNFYIVFDGRVASREVSCDTNQHIHSQIIVQSIRITVINLSTNRCKTSLPTYRQCVQIPRLMLTFMLLKLKQYISIQIIIASDAFFFI